MGLFERFQPKFVKKFANLAPQIKEALSSYVGAVESGAFPGPEHTFHMDPAELATLVTLDGSNGKETWMTFRNFHVISRYNRSPLYSMAVWQLSREIADGVAGAP